MDSFPPHYRALMRASAAHVVERIDMERAAAEQYPRFFLAWWVLGDELFHRGPLVGRSRSDGLDAFHRAAELRPDFAPAWEHLALVRIAEGDEPGAREALGKWLDRMGGQPRDTFGLGMKALLEVAIAWRFHPGPQAEVVVERELRIPEVAGSPYLAGVPRLLLSFDMPHGAIWLGDRFTQWPGRPHLAGDGLLARTLGLLALGQLDSARAGLERLRSLSAVLELGLFVAEVQAAVLLVDSAPAASWRPTTTRWLRRYAAPGALPGPLARRAAGVLALLLDQEGSSETDRVAAGSTPGFGALLEARRLARRRQWSAALARSEPVAADTSAQLSDPVLRALVRLHRAEWFAQADNPEAARVELRWAEHSDPRGYPTGPPQPADVDWGLRTLARWRLATTLDAAGERDHEVCLAYARVGRFWSAGAPAYRARADSARARAIALGCGGRR